MATNWQRELDPMFREPVVEFAAVAREFPPSTAMLVSLSGVSTWFLAGLAEIYLAGPFPPWDSISALLASLIAVTLGWYSPLSVRVLGVIGTLGLGTLVGGVVLTLNAAFHGTDVQLKVKRLFE